MQAPRFDRFAQVLAAGTDRRRVVGGLVAATLGARATSSALAQDGTPTSDAEMTWLYVQAFRAATLAPDPAAPGEYTLTLAGVDEAILGFTERPDRRVAVAPTANAVAAFAAERDDPLNATLVAPLAGRERAMVVVELLDGNYDAAAGTVAYRVAVLAEEEGDLRAAATPLAAPTAEQTFGPGHLFIDQFDCGHKVCCPDTPVGDCS